MAEITTSGNGTAGNAALFINCWNRIVQDGRWNNYAWTIEGGSGRRLAAEPPPSALGPLRAGERLRLQLQRVPQLAGVPDFQAIDVCTLVVVLWSLRRVLVVQGSPATRTDGRPDGVVAILATRRRPGPSLMRRRGGRPARRTRPHGGFRRRHQRAGRIQSPRRGRPARGRFRLVRSGPGAPQPDLTRGAFQSTRQSSHAQGRFARLHAQRSHVLRGSFLGLAVKLEKVGATEKGL